MLVDDPSGPLGLESPDVLVHSGQAVFATSVKRTRLSQVIMPRKSNEAGGDRKAPVTVAPGGAAFIARPIFRPAACTSLSCASDGFDSVRHQGC